MDSSYKWSSPLQIANDNDRYGGNCAALFKSGVDGGTIAVTMLTLINNLGCLIFFIETKIHPKDCITQ